MELDLKTAFFGSLFVCATSLAPRVGPGRALGLRIWSSITRRQPSNYRKEVATNLRKLIDNPSPNFFTVVVGKPGVGKKTAIEAATKGCGGCVSMLVYPDLTEDKIICEAHMKVARMCYGDNESALRVAWFHRLFFGKGPVIVLNVAERIYQKDPFAGVCNAAKILSKQGFRVIVEGSQDDIQPTALHSRRELRVEPMTAQELMQDDEIASILNQAGEMRDLVWAVLGGFPADYKQLQQRLLLETNPTEEQRKAIIGEFVTHKLVTAKNYLSYFLRNHPEANRFVDELASREKVSDDPPPNTMPNRVFIYEDFGYVPSNPAMAFVLKHCGPHDFSSEIPSVPGLLGITRGTFPAGLV